MNLLSSIPQTPFPYNSLKLYLKDGNTNELYYHITCASNTSLLALLRKVAESHCEPSKNTISHYEILKYDSQNDIQLLYLSTDY